MMKKLAALLLGLFALTAALAPAHADFPDQRTWGGTSTGSANAQSITVYNYVSPIVGVPLRFLPGFTNTGPLTVNVLYTGGSTGAQTVKKFSPAGLIALTGGEVVLGQEATVLWDGTQMQCLSCNTSAPQLVGGFRNLRVTVGSDTAFTIAASAVAVEDSNGYAYRLTNVSVTCTLTTSGTNGLDTGSASASNWYGGYIIYNPTTQTTACLASLHPNALTDTTGPTMPSGYTARQLATEMRYDSQPKLWRIAQYGREAQIVIGTNPTAIVGMISSSSGSINTPTWTAVATASFAPPLAAAITVSLSAPAAANGDGAMAAPNAAYGALASASNPPPMSFQVDSTAAAHKYSAVASFNLESSNIYYASTIASSKLSVIGWTLNL